LSLVGCGGGGSVVTNGGGNSGNGGGGGSTPPTPTEILYASDFGNKLFSFNIDTSSGALTLITTATIPANTVSTSSIAVAPQGNFVYATTGTSGVAAYSSNATGALSPVSGSPFPVATTLQVSGLIVDPKSRFLYASDLPSNGATAGVIGFTIGTGGALTSIPGGPFSSPGLGGPPEAITIDPTGKFLYASASFDDVLVPGGLNIWGFTIDSQTGVLTSMPGSPFATQQGGQPQGIEVDPSGKFLYVALLNTNSIAALTIDSATGALTTVPGSPFATAPSQINPQTSEFAISPSGKYLYAFNFNGSTMSAFTIDSTSGALAPLAGSPFAVNPAAEGSLIVDPSGKFLYITIGFGPPSAFDIFNIDPNTGTLTPNINSPFAGSEEPLSLGVAQFN